MDPRQLLAEHWKAIERLIAITCRRGRLSEADGDEFATAVKVKLFENDCQIVRGLRDERRFLAYMNVVIQRAYCDFTRHYGAKWHPSAAAGRLGEIALDLEKMIYREGCPPDFAISTLLTLHPDLSRAELEKMYVAIPRRERQRHFFSAEEMGERLAGGTDADILVTTSERARMTGVAATVIREYMAGLDAAERLMLQFHFEGDMQWAEIARRLGMQLKPLYRTRDRLFSELKTRLENAGISAAEISDLLGKVPDDIDFGLRKTEFRPS